MSLKDSVSAIWVSIPVASEIVSVSIIAWALAEFFRNDTTVEWNAMTLMEFWRLIFPT